MVNDNFKNVENNEGTKDSPTLIKNAELTNSIIAVDPTNFDALKGAKDKEQSRQEESTAPLLSRVEITADAKQVAQATETTSADKATDVKPAAKTIETTTADKAVHVKHAARTSETKLAPNSSEQSTSQEVKKSTPGMGITREENQRRTAEADALVYAMAHPGMPQAEAIEKGYAQYNARHKTNINPELKAEQTTESKSEHNSEKRSEHRHKSGRRSEHHSENNSEQKSEVAKPTHVATPDNRTWDVKYQNGQATEITLNTPADANHKAAVEKYVPISDAQNQIFKSHSTEVANKGMLINPDGTCLAQIGKDGELQQRHIDKSTGNWLSANKIYPKGDQSSTYTHNDLTISVKQDFDANKKSLSEMPVIVQIEKKGTEKSENYVLKDAEKHLYKGSGDALYTPVLDKDHRIIDMKHESKDVSTSEEKSVKDKSSEAVLRPTLSGKPQSETFRDTDEDLV